MQRMTPERFTGGGRSSAISRRMSDNQFRGIATSPMGTRHTLWRTTFALILISFSFRLICDQSLIGSGVSGAQEVAEIIASA
jgi:hypothetical protein